MNKISFNEFQNKSKKYLFRLLDFFDKYQIHYSLAFGTMLGAYRHGDIIPWDFDINLHITKDGLNKGSSAIGGELLLYKKLTVQNQYSKIKFANKELMCFSNPKLYL